MQISRNSWHYKFANLFGDADYADDSCAYIRQLLLTAFKVLFILSLFSILLGCAAIMAYMEPLIFVGCLIGMGGFLGFLWFMVEGRYTIARQYNLWRYSNGRLPKEPGTIGKLYRSFKDKTCVFISFTD